MGDTENGTVYHTYTAMAPDPFVVPFFNMLLERTPKPQPAEPRSWRKDESVLRAEASGLAKFVARVPSRSRQRRRTLGYP